MLSLARNAIGMSSRCRADALLPLGGILPVPAPAHDAKVVKVEACELGAAVHHLQLDTTGGLGCRAAKFRHCKLEAVGRDDLQPRGSAGEPASKRLADRIDVTLGKDMTLAGVDVDVDVEIDELGGMPARHSGCVHCEHGSEGRRVLTPRDCQHGVAPALVGARVDKREEFAITLPSCAKPGQARVVAILRPESLVVP